jgi:cytochrome c peroxidase
MLLSPFRCILFLVCLFTAAGCEASRPVHESLYQGPQYAPASDKEIITLGQRLFFDPQLSGSGHTACATCHNPGFAYGDPRPVSISDNGQPGLRNAPPLINVRLRPHLMWDGRFVSLEEQAFGPFRPDGEMGTDIAGAAARISRDPNYQLHFRQRLGHPPSPDGIVAALAAFERTLVIGNSRFDRFAADKDERALSPMEKFGLEVFTGRGLCVKCHIIYPTLPRVPLFSDFKFHNIGIGFTGDGFRDLGRGAVTSAEEDVGAFRTPSLRNVAVTGPYMHDGSLGTLEEVIAFYDGGGQPNPNQSPILQPLGLSTQEKTALIAFLYTLTDLEFQADPILSQASRENDSAQLYER